MNISTSKYGATKAPLIRISQVSATTNEGRVLFKDLNMSLSHEHVALIGRNGVGKSTLLEILSGITRPDSGKIILRTEPYFVCQTLSQRPSSREMAETLHWFQHSSLPQRLLYAEIAATGLRPLRQLLQLRRRW